MPDHPQHLLTEYRGRLAPSPTGYLHLGHARTFWIAQERARARVGTLILRNEDLDSTRFNMNYFEAMLADLKWAGLQWTEGPDCGGDFGPYSQSQRGAFYSEALKNLQERKLVYRCFCSRKDILNAARAPHASDDREPIYPGTCRDLAATEVAGRKFAWRFRVPEGEDVSFVDGNCGTQHFVAGKDFGDFVIWRQDDVPAYQLACVVDDAAMRISEVVRGADLLLSTARQILLYRALKLPPPNFFHCDLMLDEHGIRLAKRHDALSLRQLRTQGETSESTRARAGLLLATPGKSVEKR